MRNSKLTPNAAQDSAEGVRTFRMKKNNKKKLYNRRSMAAALLGRGRQFLRKKSRAIPLRNNRKESDISKK